MPPQQAYGLLDFVDDIDDFRTHGVGSSLSMIGGIEVPWT
jgi:hypothetical protein